VVELQEFSSLCHISTPIAALSANVFIQVVSFRLIVKLSLLKSLIRGFGFGLIFLFAIEWSLFFFANESIREYLFLVLTDATTYMALGYCYFHFINLGETARRIRLVRELYESNGGLTLQDVLERYNAKDIVEVRKNRLLRNGQIIYKNGRYFIGSPVMLLISQIIVIMKLIIMGAKSEFKR
jgi:hypothetical protein